MAKRDPEKTARNKKIKSIKEELKTLLPEVLRETGFDSQHSLNGKIGGKNADYIDIKNKVIRSPEEYVSFWIEGFRERIKGMGHDKRDKNEYDTYLKLKDSRVFREYTFKFLERTFWNYYEALTKKRPRVEDSEIWIGQKNLNYGILVTPRFVNGQWENDKSEIRHFKPRYWTIGHILETGFVIPGKDDKIEFQTVDSYLSFFLNTLVRASGSIHEYEIAERYCQFVKSSENPLIIPLLIPEYRYDGKAVQHVHRLDFTIVDPTELTKVGFEISPFSSHGKLSGIKEKKVKEINAMVQGNREKELSKQKDYFFERGVSAVIFTDKDFVDYDQLFSKIQRFLIPKGYGTQLKLHVVDSFFQEDW